MAIKPSLAKNSQLAIQQALRLAGGSGVVAPSAYGEIYWNTPAVPFAQAVTQAPPGPPDPYLAFNAAGPSNGVTVNPVAGSLTVTNGGLYLVGLNFSHYNSFNTGLVVAEILATGVPVPNLAQLHPVIGVGESQSGHLSLSGLLECEAGTVITAQVYGINSGNNLSIAFSNMWVALQ